LQSKVVANLSTNPADAGRLTLCDLCVIKLHLRPEPEKNMEAVGVESAGKFLIDRYFNDLEKLF